MAKRTTIGFVAQKKSGDGVYFKVTTDVKLSSGQYLNIVKKPTESDIENAKSDKVKEILRSKASKWPDWKLSELVLIENDAE
jgi:hypothetical protein